MGRVNQEKRLGVTGAAGFVKFPFCQFLPKKYPERLLVPHRKKGKDFLRTVLSFL